MRVPAKAGAYETLRDVLARRAEKTRFGRPEVPGGIRPMEQRRPVSACGRTRLAHAHPCPGAHGWREGEATGRGTTSSRPQSPASAKRRRAAPASSTCCMLSAANRNGPPLPAVPARASMSPGRACFGEQRPVSPRMDSRDQDRDPSAFAGALHGPRSPFGSSRSADLPERVSAVDHERLSGHEAGKVGGKEEDGVRYLVGRSHPRHWRAPDPVVAAHV